MAQSWVFVEFVDNTQSIYTCKDCGGALTGTTKYQKGRDTKISGQCLTGGCIFYGSTLDEPEITLDSLQKEPRTMFRVRVIKTNAAHPVVADFCEKFKGERDSRDDYWEYFLFEDAAVAQNFALALNSRNIHSEADEAQV